jgi:hypothetical protein
MLQGTTSARVIPVIITRVAQWLPNRPVVAQWLPNPQWLPRGLQPPYVPVPFLNPPPVHWW